jgi:ABC-type sugar transport system permease subunit
MGGPAGRADAPEMAPHSSSRRRKQIIAAYLLMAPTLALLAGVLAYPIAWEIWTSFTNLSPLNDAGATFVGLENYRRLVGDPEFWRAAIVTVVFALVTTIVKLALGVAFALLLATPFRGRTLVFLAVFLPWAYPASVSVIGWFWTLNPPITTAYSVFMGTIKYVVDNTLGGGAWAFISVTLFNIWRGSSFIGVFLLAGLNAIPTELFDYALLESSSAWQRFWRVTVPLLRPFLALAVFLSLTTAFADLANVWMLTAGRIVFPVIGTQAYWLAIKGGQFGPASALSLMLVPFLLVALLILFRLFEPADDERPSAARANEREIGRPARGVA